MVKNKHALPCFRSYIHYQGCKKTENRIRLQKEVANEQKSD